MEMVFKETLVSDLALVPDFVSATMKKLARLPLNEEGFFNVRLCLHEALVNAITHGNKSNKALGVSVMIKNDTQHLIIEVTGQGQGFDPAGIPDPTDPKNLTKVHGRGVFLIVQKMDEVQFFNRGRTIRMIKRLSKQEQRHEHKS